MQWHKKKTLYFIEKYREEEVLWNIAHPEHYNKLKKEDAWNRLASLLDSERQTCADEVYHSTWFAYKAMIFLLDRITPRATTDDCCYFVKNSSIRYSSLTSNVYIQKVIFRLNHCQQYDAKETLLREREGASEQPPDDCPPPANKSDNECPPPANKSDNECPPPANKSNNDCPPPSKKRKKAVAPSPEEIMASTHGLSLVEDYAFDVNGAMSGMLRALCLDDDPRRDTAYHMQVQLAAVMVPSGRDAVPFVGTKLGKIVRSLPKTTRGLDGITCKIVKHVWKAAQMKFVRLYDKCVTKGFLDYGILVACLSYLRVMAAGDRSKSLPPAYLALRPR
ncbi:hypothetical protein EVAR_63061_1 [Eumeta japonica]|uniref:MADF domain-containing protein n=1 Tax=Eumeta variegata TaxID=151549 RepID=A0A4C1Z467_EUMVA|nr:hypothetical protein EVAR_63061_1 [Eumeta japonica]